MTPVGEVVNTRREKREDIETSNRRSGVRIDPPHLVAWIRSSAQIGWAGALAPTDCAAAQKHFGKGVKILAGAPKSVNFDRARAGAKQQWITGIGGVPGCRPDAGTPPLP